MYGCRREIWRLRVIGLLEWDYIPCRYNFFVTE